MFTFKHDSDSLADAVGISKENLQATARDVLRKLRIKYINLEAYQPFTEQEKLVLCIMFLQDCEYTAETYLRSIIGKDAYNDMRTTQSRMIEVMYSLYPQASELIEVCVVGDAVETANGVQSGGNADLKQLLKKFLEDWLFFSGGTARW